MTSFSWAPVIAGLIGAAAALAGVWLNQRTNRRQRLEDRADARRLEQRDVIAELIDAAEQWVPLSEVFTIASSQARSRDDLIELTKAESTNTVGAARTRLRSALVRARLVVTDVEVRPLVLQLVSVVDEQTQALNGRVVDAALDGQGHPVDAVIEAQRFYRGVLAQVLQLQDVALERLT